MTDETQDQKPKPARDEKGRLLPGHTANPGGRVDDSELRRACQAKSQEALDTLVQIMQDDNARNMDKLKAADSKSERYTVIEIPTQSTQTKDG